MPQVIFRMPGDARREIDVPVGHTIMQGALAAGIDQIEAECGGALTCATCHIHIEDGWTQRLAPPEFAEADLLEMVDDPRPNSRLSCQIVMSEQLDGIVVAIP